MPSGPDSRDRGTLELRCNVCPSIYALNAYEDEMTRYGFGVMDYATRRTSAQGRELPVAARIAPDVMDVS